MAAARAQPTQPPAAVPATRWLRRLARVPCTTGLTSSPSRAPSVMRAGGDPPASSAPRTTHAR
jgi:hypothetical protein